jgi:hypothetical protein
LFAWKRSVWYPSAEGGESKSLGCLQHFVVKGYQGQGRDGPCGAVKNKKVTGIRRRGPNVRVERRGKLARLLPRKWRDAFVA